MTTTVFIGVGSNIGDAQRNCLAGIRAIIQDERAALTALSSFYITSPVSEIRQRDFVNAAFRIDWNGGPYELLALLGDVEKALGRKRKRRDGPRIIDLDMLLFGDTVLDEPELTIPHPRLHERKFALVPCLEIDPSIVHPRFRQPLAAFLRNIGDEQKIERHERITEDEVSVSPPGPHTSRPFH